MSSHYTVVEDGIKYDVESDGVNSIWFYTIYHLNGEISRLKGPAVMRPKDDNEWWLNGKRINCSSQEEFERLIKMKVFW